MSRSQNFNEIMPAIYSRFMEKEARQWRQIYKVCNLAAVSTYGPNGYDRHFNY